MGCRNASRWAAVAASETMPNRKRRANQFPAGWDEQRVLEIVEHYEGQTDEEAAAEDEAALSLPTYTLMPIPHALVPAVRRLLAEHRGEEES